MHFVNKHELDRNNFEDENNDYDDDNLNENSKFLKIRETKNRFNNNQLQQQQTSFNMDSTNTAASSAATATETEQLKTSRDSGYEKALAMIGFGRFQWLLLTLCALANASDAIEILCVSFILPSAQCDLNMSTADKGYLSAITFAGMMIGGYLWGTLGDIYGRKYVLISALIFNAIFAILSGLAQSFGLLLVFRLFSGIGVGGSVPIVWSYFSEFIQKEIRGRMLCCLASSWLFGNLLVIGLAYSILNYFRNTQWSFFGGLIILNDWRLFMIACALPSLITGVLFFILPESPKFCIYNNKGNRGSKILAKIYQINNKCRTHDDFERRREAFEFFDRYQHSMKQSLSDDDENNAIFAAPAASTDNLLLVNASNNRNEIARTASIFKSSTISIIKKTLSLFKKPYTFNSLINLYIMFAVCFSYYGLWMWLPELYKRMSLYGGSPCQASHVPTNGTTPSQQNQTSSCHIEDSVYVSSLYSALSNLPGNIFTIIFIDKMGRNKVTSISLLASGVSIFGIPFTRNENEGVLLTVIFGAINVFTFNSFGCTSTEIYPTKLRSTALGVQYVAGRLGAIMGNILFGLAVDTSCYIPLMTITTLLISSGFLSLKLPESNRMDMN